MSKPRKKLVPVPLTKETVSTEGSAGPHPGQARSKWLMVTVLLLSFWVLGTYARAYHPLSGWTKLICFGSEFAKQSLPRLKNNTTHYTMHGSGNDGQFYAQVAIDPSLKDPGFDQALDNPSYRARRIGMPALAFALGWSKPRRAIEIYALTNCLGWFVALGAFVYLSRPWTDRQVLGLALASVSFGAVTSMEESMVDLPASALILGGLVLRGGGRYGAFAAAMLTRETSLLAGLGGLDWRQPFTTSGRRNLGMLLLATLPLALWIVYVSRRFNGLETAAGAGNFALPLRALWERIVTGAGDCAANGLDPLAKVTNPFGWLYLDYRAHELLTVLSLFCQGLYLGLRREVDSAVWRTGVCYAVLGSLLGPAVWDSTGAAARVLLPLTFCFYLQLAKERGGWFWPFLLLGSLSVPYGVHEFWNLS